MKVTRYDLELTRPSVVALGVFDGVHLGHQTIVRRVVERARELGAAASVVTFDPHPAAVVSSSGGPAVLATLSQRLEWFEQLGVDQVRLIDFTMDIARQSAEQFVDEILVAQLGALSVVVGDDAHFGRAREGNLETLRVLGASRGFEVESAGALGEGRRYSSSLVRELLGEGDVEGANHVLGRPFTLRGVVMHGDARGRQIGYPTANLDTQEHQALPQLGIYAGLTRVEGDWIPSAISVGTRPQFYDGARPLVESYVIDYRGDLYDTEVDVAFLSLLRPEARFSSLEALVEQMGRDVAAAREICATYGSRRPDLLG
ncbi:MAG: bifunctional riboflavin kinase/FAD synthetase [Acidimicrobiaceae bacterium]|nr:bifunctional riboflavin kinase/FAD synthetase [Acidimicrobiaceae bacterium]